MWNLPHLSLKIIYCTKHSSQIFFSIYVPVGFPGGSDGKESACNVGDLS